jgi:hypothetical protein
MMDRGTVRNIQSFIECSILILMLESYLQTCMTYNIAECAVNNSWWWTEEMSERCRGAVNNSWWWTEELSETCRGAVNNSWWWTEELSGTCRVLFQNKFEKLVHLFGLIIRTLVTKFRVRDHWQWTLHLYIIITLGAYDCPMQLT